MTLPLATFRKQRRLLGRNVKDIRQLKNISLEELHAKSQISILRILQLEAGKHHTDLHMLCRLAHGLNVSLARLFRE